MNRPIPIVLILILLAQIGMVAMLLTHSSDSQGQRSQRLEQICRYTLAVGDGGLAVANFDIGFRDPEARKEAEQQYDRSKAGCASQLDLLNASFANMPKALETLNKLKRLNELADNTVAQMKAAIPADSGRVGMAQFMVLMAGMSKLNRITNGTMQLIDELLTLANGEQQGGVPASQTLLLGLSGFSILLTVLALGMTAKR